MCARVCFLHLLSLRTPDMSLNFIAFLRCTFHGVSGTVADGVYSWEKEGVSLQEGKGSDSVVAGRGCGISGTGCDSGVHVAG